MCIYIHTYIHTYIPTYLHTYIHAYIHGGCSNPFSLVAPVHAGWVSEGMVFTSSAEVAEVRAEALGGDPHLEPHGPNDF